MAKKIKITASQCPVDGAEGVEDASVEGEYRCSECGAVYGAPIVDEPEPNDLGL